MSSLLPQVPAVELAARAEPVECPVPTADVAVARLVPVAKAVQPALAAPPASEPASARVEASAAAPPALPVVDVRAEAREPSQSLLVQAERVEDVRLRQSDNPS